MLGVGLSWGRRKREEEEEERRRRETGGGEAIEQSQETDSPRFIHHVSGESCVYL